MNSRTKSNIPFVGLHAHSVAGSPFDALGYPPEHMDFAYNNGMDALALTDHGNMNGLAWQVLHAKKMKKDGKEFKPIFGCEAYFIPSVKKWKKEYYRAVDGIVRSHGMQKFLMRMLYLICFVATIILSTLLYLNS